jgi:hypothetical protein
MPFGNKCPGKKQDTGSRVGKWFIMRMLLVQGVGGCMLDDGGWRLNAGSLSCQI